MTPDAPKTPKRRAAYEQRRLAFARAFCRLGQAAAAYREVFPASRQWQADSVTKEGGRMLRDALVAAEIKRIDADAALDAIASRQEIAKLLAGIMRGTEKNLTVVGEQVVDLPANFSTRLRAAKDLERMLPSVTPAAPENQTRDEGGDKLAETLAAIRKRRAAQ